MIQLELVSPILVDPRVKHAATIEVKDNLALAVSKVDTDETTFSFTSPAPPILSALLKHTSRSGNLGDGVFQRYQTLRS